MKRMFVVVFLCLCLSPSAYAADKSAAPEAKPSAAPAQNAAATTAQVEKSAAAKPTEPTVTSAGAFWFTAAFMTSFLIIAFSYLRRALQDWNLKDALSEESSMPKDTPVDKLLDKDGRPHMVPSSSRLISFMGALVIIGTLIGFGYYMLWAYFMSAAVPDFKNITDYLLAGAGIFIPYAVNKVGGAISGK